MYVTTFSFIFNASYCRTGDSFDPLEEALVHLFPTLSALFLCFCIDAITKWDPHLLFQNQQGPKGKAIKFEQRRGKRRRRERGKGGKKGRAYIQNNITRSRSSLAYGPFEGSKERERENVFSGPAIPKYFLPSNGHGSMVPFSAGFCMMAFFAADRG